MTDTPQPTPPAPPGAYPPFPYWTPPEEDELNLLDLFRVLWKQK